LDKENIIEKTCQELGVNQTELAKLTKLDNANLSRWKSKKRKIPVYIQEYLKVLTKLNKHEKLTIV
jgi:transcriptional regulator with XRE-family HTH domain